MPGKVELELQIVVERERSEGGKLKIGVLEAEGRVGKLARRAAEQQLGALLSIDTAERRRDHPCSYVKSLTRIGASVCPRIGNIRRMWDNQVSAGHEHEKNND